MSQKLQVFISYKHHDIDGAIAQKLYDTLVGWGFDVWMDRHNIPAGVDVGSTGWISAIDKGLRESQVLFGLISDDALLSENVQHEWRWAKGNNRRIFLIKVRDFNRENMSHQFFETLYLNYPDDLSKLETDLRQFAIQRANFIHHVTDTPRDLNAEILTDLDTLASQAPKKQLRPPIYQSRFFLRALAVLIFIVGVIWLIAQPGFEPLLAFLGAIIPFLASFAILDQEVLVGEETPTDRAWDTLKDRIRRFWLEDLLRPTLQEAAALNIQVSVQPDMVIQHRELGDVDIPRGSINIRGIFDELKSFVIVGKAGAGKTVTLLQLATKLLLKPPADLPRSIPFLLNLSAWGNYDIPFEEWMHNQAQSVYRIRPATFSRWLNDKRLILLLDGLDEIRADEPDRHTMGDRIRKLNDYRRDHPDMPMVICTRPDEYRLATEDQSANKLDFGYAIQVEPLDEGQILAYLSGDELKGLRELYADDPAIQRLTKIPFLLVTMTYTYRGVTKRQLTEGIAPNDDIARIDHVFRKYLTKQLQAYAPLKYGEDKIREYLTWLATKTTASGTVFSLRNVTIDWFKEDERLVGMYDNVLFWSVIAIPTLLFGLAGYAMAGVLGAIGFALFGAIIGLIVDGVSDNTDIEGIRYVWFSVKTLKDSLSKNDSRQIVLLLFIASVIMPLIITTPLAYALLAGIFVIFMWLQRGEKQSDKWLISTFMTGIVTLYIYTLNAVIPHSTVIRMILSALLTINILVFITSMEEGQSTLALSNREWRWYAIGTFFVTLGLMVVFPSIGTWWLVITTTITFFLMTGIIPFLTRLAILHYYTQRHLSRDYPDLIQAMIKRQFLRSFAGGHTFRHDYMRQSFLGGGDIVKAQIKVLIQDLNHWRYENRENAKKALSQFGRDVLIEILVPALSHSSSDIRMGCAEVLGNIGDARAVDHLIPLLKDEDEDVRRAVAEALVQLGWQPQTPDETLWFAFAKRDFDTLVNLKAVNFLISMLQSDVRDNVAWALGNIGDTRGVDHLIPLLKDEDWYVRGAVAVALMQLSWRPQKPDETLWFAFAKRDFDTLVSLKAVDFLIPLLKDKNSDVRSDVAIALRKIGIPAVEPLIPLLKDENSDVRSDVAGALGNIGDARAVDHLIPLLKDKNKFVRLVVAGALGKIGDARAVDHLIPLLKDTTRPLFDNLRVCDYVAEALRKIGTPEALKAVRDAGFE